MEMTLARIKSKLRKNWPVILASCPLISLALFYLFVVRARLHLGFWPTYDQPDPNTLGFTVHHLVAGYTLVWLPIISVILVIALAVNEWHLARYPRTWLGIGMLVFSSVLTMVLWYLDPGDFIAWFLD